MVTFALVKAKKKFEFPNTYVIVFFLIVLAAVATWFVPGGEFYKTEEGLTAFRSVPSEPQTWQVFTTLFEGFTSQAGIIVFILVIGGAFWIVNGCKAVDVGIFAFLNASKRLEAYPLLRKIGVHNLILILIMILFSLFGAVFGMSEETIAFVVVLVPLAISMGYDSIVGVCLVYVAAHVGFAGAFLNPFTIGIAQGMADLPLFSGMGYRLVCWAVLTALTIAVVLVYAARIKRRPELSPMYELDASWRKEHGDAQEKIPYFTNCSAWVSFALVWVASLVFAFAYGSGCELTFGNNPIPAPYLLWVLSGLFALVSVVALRKSVHFYILGLLGFTIVYLVVGVSAYGWYIGEISALFLGLALAAGVAAGYSANKIVQEFLAGAKDILSAAVIVGLAAGIVGILKQGMVIDTMLYALASSLGEAGKVASLSMMYGIQTLINLFITSASAKAAITMPIMAPFADMIDLSRQATVLAFQFGDGFTNMITPTSGVLIAVLGLARIPYAKWVKWVWKFILFLILVGFLLLLPTIFFSLDGF